MKWPRTARGQKRCTVASSLLGFPQGFQIVLQSTGQTGNRRNMDAEFARLEHCQAKPDRAERFKRRHRSLTSSPPSLAQAAVAQVSHSERATPFSMTQPSFDSSSCTQDTALAILPDGYAYFRLRLSNARLVPSKTSTTTLFICSSSMAPA